MCAAALLIPAMEKGLGKKKKTTQSSRRTGNPSSGKSTDRARSGRRGGPGNRKRTSPSATFPSSQPSEPCPLEKVQLDQSWFRETCPGTAAHAAISKIEALLAGKTVSKKQSAKLLDEVLDYKGAAPHIYCPLLCARFITVVKRLAFIQAPEDLYGKLFGATVETWKDGLGLDAAAVSRYKEASRPYVAVFSIPTFLHGWSQDLKQVRKESLLAYSGFLRFKDVHTDSVQFDHAVEAFVKHIGEVMTSKDAVLAGRIALNFGQEILGPLLGLNPAMALKHTEAAASLISTAVLLDQTGTLGDDNKPVPTALRWLHDHVLQSDVPRLGTERDTPEKGSGLYGGAYKILNNLWRQVEPPHRSHMEQPYSTLLPLLGGWDRRDSRLAAPDWWVWVSFEHAGRTWRIGGSIFDLCPDGRGFHITFTNEVESCEDRQDGEEGINIVLKGGEGTHGASPSPGLDPPIKNVSVTFQLPDGSSFVCEAKALRGWKYEVTLDVHKDFCGAVFKIDGVNDIQTLKKHLDDLAPQLGMAPPPQEAPVPPAIPVSTTTVAKTRGRSGQPPNQPGATDGDDDQPSEPAAGTTTAQGPMHINAPAANCYGEIDALGDGNVALRIFLTNPGPGRKPELCERIRLTKQAHEILLAGFEDAKRRHIDQEGEQPPDEMAFFLEWTRDDLAAILYGRQKNSFEELHSSEKKVLKSAIGRVRGLATFGKEQDCKLVTLASKDSVRKTTIPIRLRRAGQPEVE